MSAGPIATSRAEPGPARPVRGPGVGWALFLGGLLAVILIPFFFWEDAFLASTRSVLGSPSGGVVLALGLAALLAGDVLLPVPSSLVSTAAGVRFGVGGGAVVSVAGLTAGCALGYALGRRLGRPAAERAAGPRGLEGLERASARWGAAVLVACRAVPVLAEASVILAGVGRVPVGRFLALTGLANLGLAIAYAWVGAEAATSGSFLLAFAGAIAIPVVAMAAWRLATRGARNPEDPAGAS